MDGRGDFDGLEVGYDIPALPGMDEADIQTPCLILDLDALERNIAKMGDYAKARFFRIFPVYWVALVGMHSVFPGGLKLEDAEWRATIDGHDLGLTAVEYQLLKVLSARPGRIKGEFEVPFERPRSLAVKRAPAFLATCDQIAGLIDNEAARINVVSTD